MIFEKYSISAFTGKKKIIKKYPIVIFLIKFELKKNLRVIEITTIWAKSAQKSIISTDFPEVAETVMCRVDGGPPFACKYFHCVV